MNNDYLQHWGIKGMKWGVRRYQNKDGTLTPAGKKRYLNSDGGLNERGQRELSKSSSGNSSSPQTKRAATKKPQMSMEELQSKHDRLLLEKKVLTLEQELKKLQSPDLDQSPTVQKGKGAVKEMLKNTSIELGRSATKQIGEWAIDQALTKAGIKQKDGLEQLKKEADIWTQKANISRAKRQVYDDQNADRMASEKWRNSATEWRSREQVAKAKQSIRDMYEKESERVQAKEARDNAYTRNSVGDFYRTVNNNAIGLPDPRKRKRGR